MVAPLRAEPLPEERSRRACVCCNVRKVEPIRGVLDGLDAWVTGLRRDQWASRANIRKIEIDHDHGGLAKINPLADWTLDEVKEYNEAHDVPVHPLYAKGFTSIGCAPCTRATSAGRGPAGRPLVVGEERPQGVRHPLPRSRPAASSTSWRPCCTRDRGGHGRLSARVANDLATAALAIDPGQREVLLEELAMLVVSLRDVETRAPWEELALGVDEGAVGEELLGRLEQILEMTLQTGRVRRVHGAESEQALLRLFHQTPLGAASRRATEAVNRTLRDARRADASRRCCSPARAPASIAWDWRPTASSSRWRSTATA